MNGLLQHHRESIEYLMPAHIVRQARRAKAHRVREERKAAPLAISQRSTPPENFRDMIAEASPQVYRAPPPDGTEIDLRRAQATMELKRLTAELGAMP